MSDLDRYIRNLDQAFDIARRNAQQAADTHNETLSLTCSNCGEAAVPGLPCWACGNDAAAPDDSWLILRSDEFGYTLVPIGAQRTTVI